MDEETENSIKADKPWLFKKGQSGNPGGRPKGKSMKDYAREMLAAMTDDERQEYLKGLPKEIIWKMAEGNPETKTDVTSGGKPIPIYGGQSLNIPEHNSDEESISAHEAN